MKEIGIDPTDSKVKTNTEIDREYLNFSLDYPFYHRRTQTLYIIADDNKINGV